jgi:hypothetical protein
LIIPDVSSFGVKADVFIKDFSILKIFFCSGISQRKTTFIEKYPFYITNKEKYHRKIKAN